MFGNTAKFVKPVTRIYQDFYTTSEVRDFFTANCKRLYLRDIAKLVTTLVMFSIQFTIKIIYCQR